jgi:phage tail-like protein
MLSMTLTPMQLPIATPPPPTFQGTALDMPLEGLPQGCCLRLSPGEPSELVVQVRNDRDQPLAVRLRVGGNVPAAWCRVGLEGNALPPKRQMDAVVYFEIPDDYFEQQSLSPGASLRLDYEGKVMLEGVDPESGRVLWQSSAPFTLMVRPHSLYPRFLPDIYKEVDFIGRLLVIFEQTFEPAVQAMDVLWAHLDPLTAPVTLLPFLAHWVGWEGLPQWPLAQQRRLIRQAMEIYRFRGTRRGLRLYLHLYTGLPLDDVDTPEGDRHIAIEEMFTRGFVVGTAALGADAVLGGGRPYHFQVRLRPPADEPVDEALVRTIIEQEKPAFCTYTLLVEPR